MKWWNVEVITGTESHVDAETRTVSVTPIIVTPIITSVLVKAVSLIDAFTKVVQRFPGKEITEIGPAMYDFIILEGD